MGPESRRIILLFPGVLQVGEARPTMEKPSKLGAYFDNLLLYRLALAGVIGNTQ